MNDTDRRGKVISLRLSNVEHQLLKTKYHDYGARNISDLARLALQRMLAGTADPQGDYAAKLSEMDERIQAIESQLQMTCDLSIPGKK